MPQATDQNASPHARKPVLVVVSGLPATGKTTIVDHLRGELGWPTFSKDAFKELLFDSSGMAPEEATRQLSTMLGQQAIALLFRVAREIIEAGTSCIIEGNFLPDLAPRDLGPFKPLACVRQIHCGIPDELVLERYRGRSQSGERHPIHADDDAIDDLKARIEAGGGRPLPLDVPLLEVDATTGYSPGLPEIVAFCRQ